MIAPIKYITAIVVVVLLPFLCDAQISQDKAPLSNSYTVTDLFSVDSPNVCVKILPSLDNDSLLGLESSYPDTTIKLPAFQFGHEVSVNFSTENSGVWDTVGNDSARIWRLCIISHGAHSINLVYDNFYMPSQGYFFLYSPDKSQVLGAFSALNNKDSGEFSTDLISNDTIILEYNEAASSYGEGRLTIVQVVHGYRNLQLYELSLTNDVGSAFKRGAPQHFQDRDIPCAINVKCSEGADWCREIASVGIIISGGHALCSGALINNTRRDFIPYFLSAFHCLDNDGNESLSNSEKSAPSSWLFRFHYYFSGCANEVVYRHYSFSGATFRAANNPSDFVLLELKEQPATGGHTDIYYSGWSKSSIAPSGPIVGIHHPLGQVMKLSIDNDAPITGSSLGHTDLWNVTWESGRVHSGSSGSPLYNSNRMIIGQLFSANLNNSHPCNATQNADYGKFSNSWTGGGTSDTRLSNWLDPGNTGITELSGTALTHNYYGEIFDPPPSSSHTRNAYDGMRVGSGTAYGVTPFMALSGSTLTLKAGEFIHLRPCTQFLSGSNVHVKISTMSCSDVVKNGDEDSRFTTECGEAGTVAESDGHDSKTFLREKLQEKKASTFTMPVNIKLSPNPTAFNVKIILEGIDEFHDDIQLSMLNELGHEVLGIEDLELKDRFEYLFSVRTLPSGTYYVRLACEKGTITKKLVVAK